MRALPRGKEAVPLIVSAAIAAGATAVATIWNARFGVFTGAVAGSLLLVQLIADRRKRREVSRLSDDIDRLLHNTEPALPIGDYGEGELAVLRDEIGKLTVRLREQRSNLEKDKRYLADLAADLSHQIRTPLTSANLALSFLREPDLPEGRRRELLRELEGLLGKIDALLTAMLKLSMFDAGTVRLKKETLPLSALVERAAGVLEVPLELRDVTLTADASGDFTGDIAWTAEALCNILKNCLEHTPSGGEISVRARENPLFSEIVVADTGAGFADEDLPRVFERFYKGKDGGAGFGIGLALARAVITAEGGTVKAANRKDRSGAVFTVRIYKENV